MSIRYKITTENYFVYHLVTIYLDSVIFKYYFTSLFLLLAISAITSFKCIRLDNSAIGFTYLLKKRTLH